MKKIVTMGTFLALICGLAAGALQVVHTRTEPIIRENERLAAVKKRQELFKDAVSFGAKRFAIKGDTRQVWIGTDKDGKNVGTVLEVSPRGYSGPVKVSFGITPEGRVSGIAINKLDQSETPGLGTKITLPFFKDQFKGKKGNALKLKKDGGDIDAITAATISSRAVASGVLEGWEWYMKAAGMESTEKETHEE